MTVSNAKIGKVGEKHIDMLATLANLTCNSAKEDEAAWDFVW